MRILIVEDDVMLALEMETILVHAGHTIVGLARDEGAAAEIANGHRADLALVDLHLAHESSGAAVARQLRTRYRTPSLFVSASPAECQRAAEDSGALGCLGKPFRGMDLIDAVAVAELIIRGQAPLGVRQGLELYATGWPPRL